MTNAQQKNNEYLPNAKYKFLIIFTFALFLLLISGYLFLKNDRHQQSKLKYTYHQQTLHHFYKQVSYQGLEDISVFLGSSLVQSLNVAKITSKSVNFGIGGEKISELTKRLQDYHSLNKAKILFIQIGGNDLSTSTDEEIFLKFKKLSQKLPTKPLIIWSALLPVTNHPKFTASGRINSRLNKNNVHIQKLCNKMPNCRYLPPPKNLYNMRTQSLKNNLHIGDGLHLNINGNKIWRQHIYAAIKSLK